MSSVSFASGKMGQAVCDRCRMIYPYSRLRPDGQSPGLQVCEICWDHMTTYASPPLQPDAMVFHKPRPLVHLVAYPYRNIPVYQGGPLSIGSPEPINNTGIPIEPNPYPPGYIPDIGMGVASTPTDPEPVDFIPPAFGDE